MHKASASLGEEIDKKDSGNMSLHWSINKPSRKIVLSEKTLQDHVYQGRDGEWYCLVGGQEFGSWKTKEAARAGMKVEQKRSVAEKK